MKRQGVLYIHNGQKIREFFKLV